METVRVIFSCLTGLFEQDDDVDEKAILDTQNLAIDIFHALNDAAKPGQDLERTLNNLVGDYGWYESLAKAILKQLEKAVRAGNQMGQAMWVAFKKSMDAAKKFAHDHPVFCTLIALGILVVLAPWIIEVLGFGETGPVEGSFAALWQARYVGYVPQGSLFSFFQRLGMVWKH